MNVGTVQSTTPAATGAASAFSGMGGDQFMQLLLAEMKNQNPLNPMNDQDFMNQVTQINSLMEMQTMSSNMQAMTLSSQMIQAADLIGKNVSYAANDGTAKSGVVSSVTYQGDQINLGIDGAEIPLKSLTGVQLDGGVQDAGNG